MQQSRFRKVLWIAGASLLLAAVAAYLFRFFMNSQPLLETGGTLGDPIGSPSFSRAQSATDSAPIETPSAGHAPLRNAESVEVPSHLQSGGGNAARSNRNIEGSISEIELEFARAARGRRFPISPSITVRCAKEKQTDATCDATRKYVSKLQLEPRDILWARDREERLETAIESLGAARFVIRALECRTDRCAAEVAGVGETLPPGVEGDPELDRELLSDPSTLGFEKGPNGETIVVTVMGYERRSAVQIKDGRLISE